MRDIHQTQDHLSPRLWTLGAAMLCLLVVVGCSSSSGGGPTSSDGSLSATGAKSVGITVILKELTNPYWVAMKTGAQAAASTDNVKLTIAAGTADSDTETQINAVQNAMSRGDKGILIASNGNAVNPALNQAKKAGLFVVALDTELTPIDTADITYATDNVQAGKLIGAYAAKKLDGKNAVIAMLDAVDTAVVPVDVQRDHGFLEGMGVDPGTKFLNGSEAKTGDYSGGQYQVACHQPSNGSVDGGRTAIENCLSANPNVNVVYAISEPAAQGAYLALVAAHKQTGVTIYTVDGSCAGLADLKSGEITADAAQYPGKMVTLGMAAIAQIARGGAAPQNSAGESFFNTGTDLVASAAVPGVTSMSVSQAESTCWGTSS